MGETHTIEGVEIDLPKVGEVSQHLSSLAGLEVRYIN